MAWPARLSIFRNIPGASREIRRRVCETGSMALRRRFIIREERNFIEALKSMFGIPPPTLAGLRPPSLTLDEHPA
jgi:hypothetical protein